MCIPKYEHKRPNKEDYQYLPGGSYFKFVTHPIYTCHMEKYCDELERKIEYLNKVIEEQNKTINSNFTYQDNAINKLSSELHKRCKVCVKTIGRNAISICEDDTCDKCWKEWSFKDGK